MFADFPTARRPRGGPVESRSGAATRSPASGSSSATAASGRPAWSAGSRRVRTAKRRFETLWTADRETARAAARICCDLALDGARDLLEPIAERLAEPPASGPDELRRAEALTGRMVAYLARA